MSRNADAVGTLLVPRLLRKLKKISRLGVDDLINTYALKNLAYDSRIRLFTALLRRVDVHRFAEAFNAETVALRRHLASSQRADKKKEIIDLQKQSKLRIASSLVADLEQVGISLPDVPAPSPGGTARQPPQNPLFSKAACYKVLDQLLDNVTQKLRTDNRRNTKTHHGRSTSLQQKAKPHNKPKPPFKRGSQVQALWGGDESLGFFPATVQGIAFVPETRKWTFALNYDDGGFDACVKQICIKGGAQALAEQRKLDEQMHKERQDLKIQRQKERIASQNRPWNDQFADEAIASLRDKMTKSIDAVEHDIQNNETYGSGRVEMSNAKRQLRRTHKAGYKSHENMYGSNVKYNANDDNERADGSLFRSDSAPMFPSNSGTSNESTLRSKHESNGAQLGRQMSREKNRKKTINKETYDASVSRAAKVLDDEKNNYNNYHAQQLKKHNPDFVIGKAAAESKILELEKVVRILQNEVLDLRKGMHASLQVTPSTSAALSGLKYRMLLAENSNLRRRLFLQDELLQHHVGTRTEVRNLLNDIKISTKQQLAMLVQQQQNLVTEDNIKSDKSSGNTRKFGSTSMARHGRPVGQATQHLNAISLAISFLKQFIRKDLKHVTERFHDTQKQIGHGISTSFGKNEDVEKIDRGALADTRDRSLFDDAPHTPSLRRETKHTNTASLVDTLTLKLTNLMDIFNTQVSKDLLLRFRNGANKGMSSTNFKTKPDTTAIINETIPLLFQLSLQLLAYQHAGQVNKEAKKKVHLWSSGDMTSDLDMSFNRLDLAETPLGKIVDAVTDALNLPTLLAQVGMNKSSGQKVGVKIARILEKFTTLLKEKLHDFDQRRLDLFGIMQRRLTAYEKLQSGNVGYSQRLCRLLQELVTGSTKMIFDDTLAVLDPILASFAKVSASESQDQKKSAHQNSGKEDREEVNVAASESSSRANTPANNFLLTFSTYSKNLAEIVDGMHKRRDQVLEKFEHLTQRHDELRRRFDDALAENAASLADMS